MADQTTIEIVNRTVTVIGTVPIGPRGIDGSGGGGTGTVESVAGVEPDGDGNVPLTAADVGAATTGALASEAATRLAADGDLQDAIDTEATTRAAADSTEATARATGDAARIPLMQKAAANGVATLGADGLIPSAQLPPLVVTDTFVVASQAAMLALTAQRGDIAVRTDLDPDGVFILTTDSPATLADWVRITAAGAVTSVDGQTGTVSLATVYAPINAPFITTGPDGILTGETSLASVFRATDTLANRPAANTVPAGALYAASDNKVIYRSDASSWATWLDLSGTYAPLAESLLVIPSSGSTEALAVGDYDLFDITIDADCTITLTGAPAVRSVVIRFNGDGVAPHTVTLPGAQTLYVPAAMVDYAVTAQTLDSGVTWDYYTAGEPSTAAVLAESDSDGHRLAIQKADGTIAGYIGWSVSAGAIGIWGGDSPPDFTEPTLLLAPGGDLYFQGQDGNSWVTLASTYAELAGPLAKLRGGSHQVHLSDAEGFQLDGVDIVTKTYADALIAANDAMVFKGVIDCSANPNYPAADRGHVYRVSVAGKIGGASGTVVEAGDMAICLTDGTAAGTQAAVGASWSIIQTNHGVLATVATTGAYSDLSGKPTLGTAAATAATDYATAAQGATADAAVSKALYDANTILAATTDNTPAALTVAASRILGRKASGDITAMTTVELAALFGTPTGAKFLADDGTLKTPSSGGPTRHVFKSGKYYTFPGGVSGDPGMVRTVTYLMPFFLDVATTFDRIGLVVSGSVASCNIHLGIYVAGSDGYPGALTLNAGTIDASSTGVKEITISQALSAGTYYLAALPVGGASDPTARGVAIFAAPGVGMAAQPSTTSGGGWWHSAGGVSALPNPFPTSGTQEVSPVPRIGLRAV